MKFRNRLMIVKGHTNVVYRDAPPFKRRMELLRRTFIVLDDSLQAFKETLLHMKDTKNTGWAYFKEVLEEKSQNIADAYYVHGKPFFKRNILFKHRGDVDLAKELTDALWEDKIAPHSLIDVDVLQRSYNNFARHYAGALDRKVNELKTVITRVNSALLNQPIKISKELAEVSTDQVPWLKSSKRLVIPKVVVRAKYWLPVRDGEGNSLGFIFTLPCKLGNTITKTASKHNFAVLCDHGQVLHVFPEGITHSEAVNILKANQGRFKVHVFENYVEKLSEGSYDRFHDTVTPFEFLKP